MANPVAALPPGQIISVPNMRIPEQGPQAASFNLDHTTNASLDGSLRSFFESGEFDFVQSVFIDNSLNAAAFNITFPDCPPNGFKITVPAFQQGVYPVTLSMGGDRFTSNTTGGLKVPVVFYNIPLAYVQWGPIVATAIFATPQGAFVDRSGVIAAGGGSQQLMAANGARKRFLIVNPSTLAGQGIAAAESLFVNFAAAAGVNDGISIELTPGGSFDSGAGPVSTQQINVTGATINHKYIAKEM